MVAAALTGDVKAYVNAIFIFAYGVGFQEIALSAGISPILEAEFVTMQRAYDIAKGIQAAILQLSAGVGASCRTAR